MPTHLKIRDTFYSLSIKYSKCGILLNVDSSRTWLTTNLVFFNHIWPEGKVLNDDLYVSPLTPKDEKRKLQFLTPIGKRIDTKLILTNLRTAFVARSVLLNYSLCPITKNMEESMRNLHKRSTRT